MSTTIKVRLPNGTIRTADLLTTGTSGYRLASVRVANGTGGDIRIAGRVTTRHGYNRVLPFEVNMDSINAIEAFTGKTIFVAAG